MKLSTRVNLLLYALVLVVLGAFLPPLQSYLDTRTPLAEIERELDGILQLRRFDYLATRQTIEYVDIILVAADPEEFAEEIEELAETVEAAQAVLGTLEAGLRFESDLEKDERQNIEALRGLYGRLGRGGEEVIGLVRGGDTDAALLGLRELMRLRRQAIAPTVDSAVSRQVRSIGENLDRLLVESGHFAFLTVFEIESAVRRLRHDTEDAIAAAAFAQGLERLMGEYLDVAFLGEPAQPLYLVRAQTDQTLRTWQHVAEADDRHPPRLRESISRIAAQYRELNQLGDRLLELSAAADPAALEFFEDDFEPLADESLAGLVDQAYAVHEVAARAGLEECKVLFVRAGRLVIGLAVLVLVLALAAPLLMSRWIVRPVLALSAAAKTWGGGDLSRRIAMAGSGELEQLADGLNRMAEGLEKARDQLHRQTRLTVLGELAGSVSHELRNPLAVIRNSGFFLRNTQSRLDDKGREHLAIIERQIRRATQIIAELLDYTRDPPVESAVFPLREACEKALETIEIPASVRLEQRLADDGPTVEADPGQIERCLVNIVVNAVQAMPEGGALRIECRRQGDEAVVAVADTGVGIAGGKLESIFEPLYTSKPRGIGLGLPVSQRYAQLNGGRIECESELGRGTTFRLFLPVTKQGDG